jgi:DnaJ-class molecular chaperone
MLTCPNCKGTGEIQGPKWLPQIDWSIQICPSCSGTLMVQDHISRWALCPKCQGWGKEPPQEESPTCSECKGLGLLPTSRAEGKL